MASDCTWQRYWHSFELDVDAAALRQVVQTLTGQIIAEGDDGLAAALASGRQGRTCWARRAAMRVTKQEARLAMLGDDGALNLADSLVDFLNESGFLPQKEKVRPGDQIFMVDGSSEDMLNKLLSKDLAGEVRLKVGRQKAEITSLWQLQPPYGHATPSKENSIFFVLRTSSDGSIVRSVNGFALGDARHQVWSSTPERNDAFQKAFNNKHWHHVFFFMLYHGEFWGLLRMSSPQDDKLYGPVSFWCWSADDIKKWSWLGSNFKVQWLRQCREPVGDCPNFVSGMSNYDYFKTKADGHVLDTDGAWAVAQHLLKCRHSPHGELEPEKMAPSSSTQLYQEHVHRPLGMEYARQNPTAQQPASNPKAKPKAGYPAAEVERRTNVVSN